MFSKDRDGERKTERQRQTCGKNENEAVCSVELINFLWSSWSSQGLSQHDGRPSLQGRKVKIDNDDDNDDDNRNNDHYGAMNDEKKSKT